MTRPPVSLSQHLLTRSDLARLGIPAGRILMWLARGWLDQVGNLPNHEPHGDPVFTVLTRELRSELSDGLAALGKDTVVFSPLRVRSFLMRAMLLHRQHKEPVVDSAENEPAEQAALPDQVTDALLDADVGEVLRIAAEDLEHEVDTVLELAREEARLEAIEQATEGQSRRKIADELPDFLNEREADSDDEEHVDFFDASDLAEELGNWSGDDVKEVPVEPVSPTPPEIESPPEATDETECAPEIEVESAEPPPPVAVLEPTPETTTETEPSGEEVMTTPAAGEPAPMDEEITVDLEPVTDTFESPTEDAAAAEAENAPGIEEEPSRSLEDALDAVFSSGEHAEPEGEVVDANAEPTPGEPPAADDGELPFLEPLETEEPSQTMEQAMDAVFPTEPAEEVQPQSSEVIFEDTPLQPAAAEADVPAADPDPLPELVGVAAENGEAELAHSMRGEVADPALSRVESFLGELRGVLVEMANRPQPMTVDVQPLVEAVQQGFSKSREQSAATDSALASLTNRIGDFGDKVEHGVALAVHAALGSRSNAPASAPTPTTYVVPRQDRTSMALFAIGFLVLCWTVVFWFKTGNPRLALGTLIGANVIGCCLLVGRRNG